jgi:hypothetical protein
MIVIIADDYTTFKYDRRCIVTYGGYPYKHDNCVCNKYHLMKNGPHIPCIYYAQVGMNILNKPQSM